MPKTKTGPFECVEFVFREAHLTFCIGLAKSLNLIIEREREANLHCLLVAQNRALKISIHELAWEAQLYGASDLDPALGLREKLLCQ